MVKKTRLNKLFFPFIILFFLSCQNQNSYNSFFLNNREKWTVETLTKFALVAGITIIIHFIIAAIIIVKTSRRRNMLRMPVHEIMLKPPPVLEINNNLTEALKLLLETKMPATVIVDNHKRVIGLISRQKIDQEMIKITKEDITIYNEHVLSRKTIEDLVDKDIYRLASHESIEKAINIFKKSSQPCIPIVNTHDIMVGIILPQTIFPILADSLGLTEK